MIESPSEEEDDEDENKDDKKFDEEKMAPFIKKINMFISKRRLFKENRKENPR
jgi:hypothetical protein